MADPENQTTSEALRPGPSADGGRQATAALDYKKIFDSAPALFLVLGTDPGFTIADASDAYLRATRTRRESIVGRPLFDVFPDHADAPDAPDAPTATRLRESLQKVLAARRADTMAAHRYDIRRPQSEGGGYEEHHWAPVNSPVLSDSGDVLWIVHRLDDVTALERAKVAVPREPQPAKADWDSEEHLRAIVETTPECVKIVARDGTILQMNASGLAMVGAPSAEAVIGKNAYTRLVPEHREAFEAFIQHVCDGEKGTLEFDLLAFAGTRQHMETHAAPLRMADQTTVALMLTRDVTVRRTAEVALREADRRKDEFIATLSHELRNPLAPLRNALNLLRLTTRPDGKVARVYDIMERQLDHLVRLVDDLLEASRISRGVLELRRERVELASVVQSAVETSSPVIREAGHELVVKLPQDLVWLDGDRVRLAQIFSNLLNNAARFTDAGGRVTIDAEARDGQARISVRDTGRGFAPEISSRLFEMFAKGDRSSGLGIGLAISRRLAEMHGGDIEGRSDGEQQGAEFVVRLPLAAADGETPRGDTATRQPRAPSMRRVLVADDNRDSANLLAELVAQLGSEVTLAYDGEEAVEVARAFQPDVAVLDIGMPKMDGYEAARRIRSESGERSLKLIALTGWGQAEDRRRAREAGFDEHLVKPVELAALRALLAVTPSVK